MNSHKTVADFLTGKSALTQSLFQYFIYEYRQIGAIILYPAKTMIGISNGHKRSAWITQPGKNFVHVVFPFQKSYPAYLSFQKTAQVPGDAKQFNHHFSMYNTEDINEEVICFISSRCWKRINEKFCNGQQTRNRQYRLQQFFRHLQHRQKQSYI